MTLIDTKCHYFTTTSPLITTKSDGNTISVPKVTFHDYLSKAAPTPMTHNKKTLNKKIETLK